MSDDDKPWVFSEDKGGGESLGLSSIVTGLIAHDALNKPSTPFLEPIDVSKYRAVGSNESSSGGVDFMAYAVSMLGWAMLIGVGVGIYAINEHGNKVEESQQAQERAYRLYSEMQKNAEEKELESTKPKIMKGSKALIKHIRREKVKKVFSAGKKTLSFSPHESGSSYVAVQNYENFSRLPVSGRVTDRNFTCG